MVASGTVYVNAISLYSNIAFGWQRGIHTSTSVPINVHPNAQRLAPSDSQEVPESTRMMTWKSKSKT